MQPDITPERRGLKMKEHPIHFRAPMVRAILAGHKTQERRAVKPQPMWVAEPYVPFRTSDADPKGIIACPYGQRGDRLWVKETTLKVEDHGYIGPVYAESDDGRACLSGGLAPSDDDCTDVEPWEIKRRPSIFMPRSMARILLEVVSVRVERLNDISESDCWAEGIEEVMHQFDNESQARMAKRLGACLEDAKPLYAQLWESINGANSWDKNPWVWVVEFKRIKSPKGE